ncbi:MAG: DUF6894 family protein [Janthinobacterium lividum]
MAIFHLHIRTGDQVYPDLEGLELSDLAAARAEAIRGARSLMSAEVLGGTLTLDQSIEIEAADGRHLASIAFADALAVHGGTIGLAPPAASPERRQNCGI